jgi:integrase
MRDQLAAGKDPLEEKKASASSCRIPDFRTAATLVHTQLLPGWKNAKHGQQWINTVSQYALPVLGELPLNEIQPRHIADVLRPIWLSKPETASRLKQRLDAIMAWGWAHGHCAANPVDVVTHLLPQQPGKATRVEHQPALRWQDIPAFIKKHFPSVHGRDQTCPMLELLILTAARSGEVRGMRWQEIDFDQAIWTVPAERMKAKLAHRVPLSSQAFALLQQRWLLQECEPTTVSARAATAVPPDRAEDLVFPSPRDGVVLSDMVLTAFLRRIKAPSDTPGRIATAHGFRSSFRNWCSEQGYARDLAERALAHTVSNKVEAAYHRTDLLDQRRPMMQAWADFCRPRPAEVDDDNSLAARLEKGLPRLVKKPRDKR